MKIIEAEINKVEVAYKTLFKLYDGEFEVTEKDMLGTKMYSLFIEYYLGSKKLESIIEWYKEFKNKFHKYLLDNHSHQRGSFTGNIYKARELAVDYDGSVYWVDAGISEQYAIWDLYYYIDDVIKELEKLSDKILMESKGVKINGSTS